MDLAAPRKHNFLELFNGASRAVQEGMVIAEDLVDYAAERPDVLFGAHLVFIFVFVDFGGDVAMGSHHVDGGGCCLVLGLVSGRAKVADFDLFKLGLVVRDN